MNTDPIYCTIAALFGAIVGSFLNVVILRLPQDDISIVFPASHCPNCKHQLSWYENIPILSYLIQKGKCRHCKIHISLQYPCVELLMSLLSAAIFYRFGLTIQAASYFILSAALLVIIYIDIAYQIIPDTISLPGILLGFVVSCISPHLRWQDSLLGILLGGGILFAVAYLYLLLRKREGMGGGDIKLLAMLGAFLGWQSLPFIILASSLSGSLFGLITILFGSKDSATRIPFGPFLALAAYCYLFFSSQIQFYFTGYLSGQWP